MSAVPRRTAWTRARTAPAEGKPDAQFRDRRRATRASRSRAGRGTGGRGGGESRSAGGRQSGGSGAKAARRPRRATRKRHRRPGRRGAACGHGDGHPQRRAGGGRSDAGRHRPCRVRPADELHQPADARPLRGPDVHRPRKAAGRRNPRLARQQAGRDGGLRPASGIGYVQETRLPALPQRRSGQGHAGARRAAGTGPQLSRGGRHRQPEPPWRPRLVQGPGIRGSAAQRQGDRLQQLGHDPERQPDPPEHRGHGAVRQGPAAEMGRSQDARQERRLGYVRAGGRSRRPVVETPRDHAEPQPDRRGRRQDRPGRHRRPARRREHACPRGEPRPHAGRQRKVLRLLHGRIPRLVRGPSGRKRQAADRQRGV